MGVRLTFGGLVEADVQVTGTEHETVVGGNGFGAGQRSVINQITTCGVIADTDVTDCTSICSGRTKGNVGTVRRRS